MSFTLSSLARHVGGRVEGDGDRRITGVAGLPEAGPGDITLMTGSRHRNELATTKAVAVITSESQDVPKLDTLRVENPYLAFALVLELFHPPLPRSAGVHPTAVVEKGARIDPEATVAAFCFIGEKASIGPGSVVLAHGVVGAGAVIGRDALLHPRVTVLDGIRIGDRVTIHSGSVIGSDGFGYVIEGETPRKIPQVGGVEIGDDVEIGANVTIDRATTGTTRVGKGTKIDNLVQIAHNVEIGENSIIVAQVGISGSTRIGKGVMLGGQAGVVGHVKIGDNARVAAQAGVMNDVPPGETVSGIGPLPHRRWLRTQAAYNKLPDLRQRIKDLEKKVSQLFRRTQ